VLWLVSGGYSSKEIGRTLGISDGTVRNHLTDILEKLQAPRPDACHARRHREPLSIVITV
jgi:DNA-binding CsgD family transcriptional regulator